MRTFFVTIATSQKRCLLQSDRYAQLLVDVLLHYQSQGQFRILAFVIMPDHAHIVLCPENAGTVEKCVQLIKGGFSYRIKKELGRSGEIWQQRFHDHRLREEREIEAAIQYTHRNPVRRGLCASPTDFKFSSAHPSWKMEPSRATTRA